MFSPFISGLQQDKNCQFVPFQLIIILTDNISRTTEFSLLKLENVVIKRFKIIPNPQEKPSEDSSSKPWVGSGYTKLYIWSMI